MDLFKYMSKGFLTSSFHSCTKCIALLDLSWLYVNEINDSVQYETRIACFSDLDVNFSPLPRDILSGGLSSIFKTDRGVLLNMLKRFDSEFHLQDDNYLRRYKSTLHCILKNFLL